MLENKEEQVSGTMPGVTQSITILEWIMSMLIMSFFTSNLTRLIKNANNIWTSNSYKSIVTLNPSLRESIACHLALKEPHLQKKMVTIGPSVKDNLIMEDTFGDKFPEKPGANCIDGLCSEQSF